MNSDLHEGQVTGKICVNIHSVDILALVLYDGIFISKMLMEALTESSLMKLY